MIGDLSVSFFFQAEDGIRDDLVTGVQTCALPIFLLKEFDVTVGSWVKAVIVPNLPAVVIQVAAASALLRLYGDTRNLLVAGGCLRSEEGRGGEEGRSRWAPYHLKKKRTDIR